MVHEVLLVAVVAFLGGFVKGLSGFGYALVSTGLLLMFYEPSTAVALMIIPLIASNIEILGEMSWNEILNCLSGFSHYLVTLLVGAILGTFLTGQIPGVVFNTLLGVFVLSYTASRVLHFEVLDRFTERCFRGADLMQSLAGLVSGIVFGASNTGVQIVAYIESQNLDRSRFVGMIAISMIGVSTARLVTAGYLGFLRGIGDIYLSTAMAVSGVVAVYTGRRISERLERRTVKRFILALLAVIGLRLLTSGLGIV
jgi:uncharacterized membrane protein YfcA